MPSSIKCLKKLRMLCLEQCVIGDGLSLIGGLKKLRILSLSGSVLNSFPNELGHNLQLLDTSNCSKLGVIPPNVISCLNNLEELYMRNNLFLWEHGGKKASLAELGHLHQLTALDIQILDLDVFPKSLFFDSLDYYMITIGDFKMFLLEGFKMPDKLESMKAICCSHLTGASFRKLKTVKIKTCHQLENLFSFSLVRLLTNLNTIEVSECDALKDIVDLRRQGNTENDDGEDEIDKAEFSQLQHVTLQGLSKFIGFCSRGTLPFDERVEIPNLDMLELSSINISHIWSNLHPWSNSNFQSLIK
ncbi:hypothetical protein L6164_002764 [Bauhinia variegata]|uniref:Uncharacterized protein n=1 Tax=Bauhinia variegata TaxID=167791 RepID=A0ACB9PZ75_BAUVA|nr:hypothetical protein L6164_002764 [Bauhinia variegata]